MDLARIGLRAAKPSTKRDTTGGYDDTDSSVRRELVPPIHFSLNLHAFYDTVALILTHFLYYFLQLKNN